MSRRAAVALIALVSSLTLLAAGCGGGDDSSTDVTATDEWATSFCTAVRSWVDELDQIRSELGNPSSLSRDTLEQAATDVDDATQTLVDDLRGLGRPDTESGQEVRDALDSLSDTLENERAEIETAIDGISSLTDVPGAITTIGSSVSAMGTALADTQSAIDDADVEGDLRTAFENSDACDQIAG
jgi:hypothetical protein